jgi:protease I
VKAIIITGKFVTDSEYVYSYYRLLEEGYKVDVAVKGKETVFGIIGEKVVPTMDIPIPGRAGEWDLLILPGGAKAMEYLRQDGMVLDFIAHHHHRGGVIGCICHGAQLLISAGLVRDHKISGYYSIKDDIINAGGIFIDAPFVTYDRIITSPHYKYLGPWMKEVLRVASGK